MKLIMHKRLSRKYRLLLRYRRFLAAESLATCEPVVLHKKIISWLSGFNSNKYHLYDFETHARSDYWRDMDACKIRAFNSIQGLLLQNKDFLHTLLAHHRVAPPVLGVLANNRYYANGKPAGCHAEEFINDLAPYTFLHALSDTAHDGILLCKTASGFAYCQTTSTSPLAARHHISDWIRHGCWQLIASPRVEPHLSEEALDSSVLQPLRIVTFRTSEAESPFIGFSLQLINADCPLYCRVNLQEGILSPAAEIRTIPPHKTFHDLHPETGATIAGQTIKDWSGACALAIRAHSVFPRLRAVSWHLLFSEEGWQVIDASNVLRVDLAQLHGPLLLDRSIISLVCRTYGLQMEALESTSADILDL
jgi:hypothetical protein